MNSPVNQTVDYTVCGHHMIGRMHILAAPAQARALASFSHGASKRKQVSLKIEKKLEILQKVNEGVSFASIATQYGIGKFTVLDIKKGRDKILKFAGEAQDGATLKQQCNVRKTNDEVFHKAMHLWFTQ